MQPRKRKQETENKEPLVSKNKMVHSNETIISKISDGTELQNKLPPMICNNPHELIAPQKVHIKFSDKCLKTSLSTSKSCKSIDAVPKHTLSITWSPNCLCFEIDQEVINNKLWIWNVCPRTVYLQVYGFWNDTAQQGASWMFWPKTRFRLASGLKAEVIVKATPKDESPVPLAYIALQLAVAHVRDTVVGYFVVPIKVKFDNCKIMALAGEG